MPIATDKILKLVCDLSEEENIKVAVSESLKGGLITGATTVVGGLLMGPIGLAAGGVFGGISTYIMSQGKFQSVPYVIMTMEPSRREILADKVRVFLQTYSIRETSKLATIFSNPILRLLLIEVVIGVILSLGVCLVTKYRERKKEMESKDCDTNLNFM